MNCEEAATPGRTLRESSSPQHGNGGAFGYRTARASLRSWFGRLLHPPRLTETAMTPVVSPPRSPRPVHPVVLQVEAVLERQTRVAIPLEELPGLLAQEGHWPERPLEAILQDLRHAGERFHLIRPPRRRWVGAVSEGWILLRRRSACGVRDPITHHVRESLRLLALQVDPTSERALARWSLYLLEEEALARVITKNLRKNGEEPAQPPAPRSRPRRPASGTRGRPTPPPPETPSIESPTPASARTSPPPHRRESHSE